MNIYFVDYENVSLNGLNALERLSNNDYVNILYSKNACLNIENIISKYTNTNIQCKFVNTGKKNALDIQLASLFGYYLKECGGENNTFYFISKDQIFLYVKNFFSCEATIRQYPSIEDAILGKNELFLDNNFKLINEEYIQEDNLKDEINVTEKEKKVKDKSTKMSKKSNTENFINFTKYITDLKKEEIDVLKQHTKNISANDLKGEYKAIINNKLIKINGDGKRTSNILKLVKDIMKGRG